MKAIIIAIAVFACFVVKSSNGYLCFECNSLNDTNCYDLTPRTNTYVGVPCDINNKGEENCYFAQISENKKRRMVRGCKKAGYCEELNRQEQTNIYFKSLFCNECSDHFCNKSQPTHFAALSLIVTLLISSLVHTLIQ